MNTLDIYNRNNKKLAEINRVPSYSSNAELCLRDEMVAVKRDREHWPTLSTWILNRNSHIAGIEIKIRPGPNRRHTKTDCSLHRIDCNWLFLTKRLKWRDFFKSLLATKKKPWKMEGWFYRPSHCFLQNTSAGGYRLNSVLHLNSIT